jgi:hypothetical protein
MGEVFNRRGQRLRSSSHKKNPKISKCDSSSLERSTVRDLTVENRKEESHDMDD